jgi:hypothetical protein
MRVEETIVYAPAGERKGGWGLRSFLAGVLVEDPASPALGKQSGFCGMGTKRARDGDPENHGQNRYENQDQITDHATIILLSGNAEIEGLGY